MGLPKTEEEQKKYPGYAEGKLDEQGFYVLPDGSFFDPDGYYFDQEGYDEFGGYYDDDLYYVPGEEYEEQYYEDLKVKLDDEEKRIIEESLDADMPVEEHKYEEEAIKYHIIEHVAPALKWLQEQPDKKFVIQIKNIPNGVKTAD